VHYRVDLRGMKHEIGASVLTGEERSTCVRPLFLFFGGGGG
jgi:hypothetical protein